MTADGAGAGSAAAEKHLLRWTIGLAAEEAGASTAAATDLETVLKEREDLAALKAKAPAALRKAMLRSPTTERWLKVQHAGKTGVHPAGQIYCIKFKQSPHYSQV